ncbi:hypothetical protein [Kribbella lupini]|uniref:CXXC-20-CXXC protein n=1 Tax=Kribbella lupini TaxID=291602 RepID=A0ABN2B7G8_9ACTN
MTTDSCWFCGRPASVLDSRQVHLHRDVDEALLGMYAEWKATSVGVPRCHRCRLGHDVHRVVWWVLVVSAAVTGILLVASGASRLSGEAWADEWQLVLPVLWTLAWLGLWQVIRRPQVRWRWVAPRPERWAREHPAVLQLVDEGWLHRGGPF